MPPFDVFDDVNRKAPSPAPERTAARNGEDFLIGRISRAQFLKGSLALTAGTSLISLLPACGGTEADGVEQQLQIGIAATPPGWDADLDFGPWAEELMFNLNDQLVRWKLTEGEESGVLLPILDQGPVVEAMVPRLATSWSNAGDRIQTFELRRGVLSHAGNELTAEDVRWTYERHFELEGVGANLNATAGLESIDDVTVLDRYTVQFTLTQPGHVFLAEAPISHRPIYDSTEMKKHATADDPYASQWSRTGDAGFGPYRLVSHEPGKQVVLERFDDYYLDPPPIERITLTEVPSSANRLGLTSRGDMDMASQLKATEYGSLAEREEGKVWNLPSVVIASFEINPHVPPLDRLEVREALAWATPYDAIIDGVFAGFAQRAGGWMPSFYPGAQNYFADTFTTDLDEARRLLVAAGVGDGFSTVIAYNAEDERHEQMAVVFQTNLREIGVRASLNGLSQAEYVAEHTSRDLDDKFPIVVWIDGSAVPSPLYSMAQFFLSSAGENYRQIDMPGFDDLMETMSRLTDFSAVVEAGDKAQQIMVEQVPWIFAAEPGMQIASTDSVVGLGSYILYFNFEPLKKE